MFKSCGILLAVISVANAQLAEKPHPRLWFPASAEPELRMKIATDPLAARLQTAIIAEADRVLKARTCRYEIPDGKRLLRESRLALHNIAHSAWAYRTKGGEPYRLRAIAELDAACSLKDWNPSHFLDTAEMATAVAIGYDWLYASLSPQQRSMCEKAMIDKALLPAKAVYDKNTWWSKPGNNWSQVCGAGIALGAAAIAGHDEGRNDALSEELFTRGLDLVEDCGEFYHPDGMYPEGPGYWHYGTNFHVMMLAACPPLGRELVDDPILRKAGESIMHLTSPIGISYNFADGNPGHSVPSAAQAWIATRYKDAAQARFVRDSFSQLLDQRKGRLDGERWFPLTLLWLPPAPTENSPLPLAGVFQGEQAMAMFRTGWQPQDAWLAIKGGTPAASHGHMDVGSFAYDAHGERWLHDLGSENYNLPGYFGKTRWDYFRLQNRSHNTLEINGKLQNPKSKPCPLTDSKIAGNPLAASFDLTDAYQGSASRVVRSARFDKKSGRARIEDQITEPAGQVIWRALTDATIEIKGDTAILRKKGKQISVRKLSAGGTWSTASATPPLKEENQNKPYRVLVLTVPQAPDVKIAVEIQP